MSRAEYVQECTDFVIVVQIVHNVCMYTHMCVYSLSYVYSVCYKISDVLFTIDILLLALVYFEIFLFIIRSTLTL